VGSGSSAGSIFAPPATYSRSAKSIGSMKAFGPHWMIFIKKY
jgi:hypothetical protein